MKRFIPRLSKKVLGITVAVVVAVGLTAGAKAWWPNRPTFTWQNPAPYVTFDSITDNPSYGNELTFFDGKDAANTNNGGFSDPVTVTPGETLLLRMYVHNDASSSLNGANLDGPGVAHNVTARIFLPTATDTVLRANAYIDSSNANPTEVADTVDLNGNSPFSLQYIPGSAVMYNGFAPNGFALSDSIVQNGASIGFAGPDGTIPGCSTFSGFVTIKVKINAPAFTLQKSVANIGDAAWSKTIVAQPGATISYNLAFTNTGTQQLGPVVLRDKLPNGIAIVHNSSVFYNPNYPNGQNLGTDDVITGNGVNIGNYAPTENAFIIFKATVPTADKLQCGTNTFVNTGEAWVGSQMASDTATVKVTKTCAQTPTFSCDLLKISQGTNRTVNITQFDKTATGGATFTDAVISWGDNSSQLTTNNVVGQTHQYAADGTYTVSAVAHFKVNGTDKTADGSQCAQTVSFTTPTTPTTPTQLVNTGPGNIVGIVGAATVIGAIVHSLFMRRLARR